MPGMETAFEAVYTSWYFYKNRITFATRLELPGRSRGRPIIGADINHFYDYQYRPFSKQICRYFLI